MKRLVLLALVFLPAVLLGSAAEACGTRVRPASDLQVREISDVIVAGTLTFSAGVDSNNNRTITGEIAATAVEKGPQARSYSIRQVGLVSYCSGWGWDPDPDLGVFRYEGRFFLKGGQDGTYWLLRYER